MPTMTDQEIIAESNRLNAGHVQQNQKIIAKHIEENCKLSWTAHKGPDGIKAVLLLGAGWIDWIRIDEMLSEQIANGARDKVAVVCVDRVYEMMPEEKRGIIDYIFGADMFGRPMPRRKGEQPVFVFESRCNPEQVSKWQGRREMVITRDSTFFSENGLLWQIGQAVGRRKMDNTMPPLIACGGNAGTMALSTITQHWIGMQQLFFFGHDYVYWAMDPECGNERIHRGPHYKGMLHTGAYAYTKPDYWFFKDWIERHCRDYSNARAQRGQPFQFVSMSIGLLGRNENGFATEPPQHLTLAGINNDLAEVLNNEQTGGGLQSEKYKLERIDCDPPSRKGNRYGATWPDNITARNGMPDPRSGMLGHWTNDQGIRDEVRAKAETKTIDIKEAEKQAAVAE